MTDVEFKKRVLIRLSKGLTELHDLSRLAQIFKTKYKKSGKDINAFIEFQSFNELLRRLKTSVFSEVGRNYPIGYQKYCISGEYRNTKLFIKTTKRVMAIGLQAGDITNPNFFGQPNSGYEIKQETIIHMLIRHNASLNNFINQDSLNNDHNPSSFDGYVALPLIVMFMALRVIDESDWRKAVSGKNLICHFSAGGQKYTLVRKGSSKEIESFYPRNDDLEVDYLQLKRKVDKMDFERI